MTALVFRSIDTPLRPANLPFEVRWKGKDKGLVLGWEIGRRLALKKPGLAEKALNDELPELDWKGGTDKASYAESSRKDNERRPWFGSLHYLAQWQGLRGNDLDIDLEREYIMTCSRTGIKFIYTSDINKMKD